VNQRVSGSPSCGLVLGVVDIIAYLLFVFVEKERSNIYNHDSRLASNISLNYTFFDVGQVIVALLFSRRYKVIDF